MKRFTQPRGRRRSCRKRTAESEHYPGDDGGALALVSCHQGKRLTWEELRDAAERVARGLWSLGIRPGDRVGLWSTNCMEWVLVQLGCARAGAVLVNVNPAYGSHELAFVLRRSRMKALFLWRKDQRVDYSSLLG